MTDTDTTTDPTAADGRPLPTLHTFTHFIQVQEDGALHNELSKALQEINARCNQHLMDFGGKPKGKLTITIDFTLEKGVFVIEADHTVKLPKPPRSRSYLWSTADHFFTPANPKQMQMFGVREVTMPAADTRAV